MLLLVEVAVVFNIQLSVGTFFQRQEEVEVEEANTVDGLAGHGGRGLGGLGREAVKRKMRRMRLRWSKR